MKFGYRQLAAAMFAVLALGAAAEAPIPPAGHRVTDLTMTLSGQEQQGLAADLERIEIDTGARVLVLIVESLEGEAISAYAARVFEAWKPGRPGVDDGVLIVLSKRERRVRIEVGRGLEGAIPDVVAGRIVASTMVPAFARGDFASGFSGAVGDIGRLVANEKAREPQRVISTAETPATSLAEAWSVLGIIAFLFLLAVGLTIRRLVTMTTPPFLPQPLNEKELRFLRELTIAKKNTEAAAVDPWPASSACSWSSPFGSTGSFGATGGSGAGANNYDTSSSAGTSAGGGAEKSY
jgi:uncharacterized membrane protein YgcG